MIENRTLVDLGDAIQLELNRLGRVAKVSSIKQWVSREHGAKLRALKINKISTDILAFLESQPIYFYVFDVDGVKYVGLSRDTMYYNPRIATALANISDVERERCLKSDTLRKATKGKRGMDGSIRFAEYEKARCALALLELMEAVEESIDGDKVNVPRFLKKVTKMSKLAKYTLGYFCGNNTRQRVCSFFYSFGIIFKYLGDEVLVKRNLMKALVTCFQIDLVWSFSGSCMCMGLLQIERIKAECDAFVERAGLTLIPQMDLEEWTEKFLRSRPIMCFIPGDGNAWLTNPIWPVSREVSDQIAEFLQGYLPTVRKRSIFFNKVLEVIAQKRPEILDGFGYLTWTDICVALYNKSHSFSFKDGRISLGIGANASYLRLSALEVPLDIGLGAIPPNVTLGPGRLLVGYIVDIGVLSAVIKIKAVIMESGAPYDFFAFCHVSFTLHKGEIVRNFGDVVQIRDVVTLQADYIYRPTVRFPYFLACTHIVNIKDREYIPNNHFTNSRNPSYEIPETANTNSETFRQFSPVGSIVVSSGDEDPEIEEEPRVPPVFQYHPQPLSLEPEISPKKRWKATGSKRVYKAAPTMQISNSQLQCLVEDIRFQCLEEDDRHQRLAEDNRHQRLAEGVEIPEVLPDASTGAIPKRRPHRK